MKLLLLVIVQSIVIMWLHYLALRRNLQNLRRHLANKSIPGDGPVWVDGGRGGYSFSLCEWCVDRLMVDKL